MIQTGGSGAQTVCDARMAVLRLDVCGLNHRGGIGSILGSSLLTAIGDGHGPDPAAADVAWDAAVWLGAGRAFRGPASGTTEAQHMGTVLHNAIQSKLEPRQDEKHNPWIQMH